MHPVFCGRTSATPRLSARVTHLLLLALIAAVLGACGQGAAEHTDAAQAHAGHAEDGEHGHDEPQAEHGPIRLSKSEIAALDLELASAGPGSLAVTQSFPGKVRINQERYAHVVARVPGVAAAVKASVGEKVQAGDTLAVLESRGLAEATAAYLGAREQLQLAHDHFERLDRLFAKGIATEREHLQARKALAEAEIDAKAAEHGLRALGFSERWIEKLPQAPESARFRYPLTAPIDGIVIRRHLTRGEAVAAETETFEIADLSTVWVDFSIFPGDMAKVHEGQSVRISAGALQAEGTISWVRPIVSDDTRAALARVVLPNPERRWKPGMFADGRITLDRVEAPLVVTSSALQTVEGETVVFVKTAEGFVPRPVVIGAEGGDKVAIESGLEPGQRYVAEGAFTLKAELAKGSFEAGHSH